MASFRSLPSHLKNRKARIPPDIFCSLIYNLQQQIPALLFITFHPLFSKYKRVITALARDISIGLS